MDDITRHSAVAWLGALDVEDTGSGMRPTRIPPAAAYQLQPGTRWSATVCSGVRLAFRSDTTAVAVRGKPFRITWPGHDPAAVIDVRVDGVLVARDHSFAGVVGHVEQADLSDLSLVDNGEARLDVGGLDPVEKDIEIWLPHGAGFTVEALMVDDGSTVEPVDTNPGWIHYGSSISQCAAADGPSEVWPAIAARVAGLDVTNLGFGAECHVDQFVARHIRDTGTALISLKLGINSYSTLTERTFPSAVHGFLDTVRDGHADTPIVLCSPIYCPFSETAVGPLSHDGTQFVVPDEPPPFSVPGLLTLVRTRELLEEIVEARRGQGDTNIFYLSGLELFGTSDADDLPDNLHPNAAGIRRMGERFASKVLGTGGLVADLGW